MRFTPALLVLPGLIAVLSAQETSAPAPKREKLTSAQVEALARKALASQDPEEQRAALAKIRGHVFSSSLTKEREFVLFAQGIMEDRLGDPMKAAQILHKLERTWPSSPYLPQIQIILATEAVERRRFVEAESRLKHTLEADLPVESKRRAQELLLWTLTEQGRQADGLPIVKTLYPLGTAKPSERGLVGILEVLCLAKDKEQAEAARNDLHNLYPVSGYRARADLAWARMLGTLGDMPGSASAFRDLIQAKPNTPEADEARLALASLLTEGKLQPKEAEAFPTPQKLLSELRKADRKGNSARRALLVELRLHMNGAKWKEAVDTAGKLRGLNPTPDEASAATQFRADAFKAWTQQVLDSQQIAPLLPYLDREGIQCLSSEQRIALVRRLSQTGLPNASKTVLELAPPSEQMVLRKSALEVTASEALPDETLGLLPIKGEDAAMSLHRAQALVVLKRWNEASKALPRSKPGPERILTLLAYLRRPKEKNETSTWRLREAEGWLNRAPEKGADREALAILVADLRAKAGAWSEALALYPADPQAGNKGWVALMRATCQIKLGQQAAARNTLEATVDEPDFKMERQTLAKQLGM